MLIFTLLWLTASLTVVWGKHVTGVFTEIQSVSPLYHYESDPVATYVMTVLWELAGSEVSPGDTFSLSLPCVFVFPMSAVSFGIPGGNNYFSCNFTSGLRTTVDSTVECVIGTDVPPGIFLTGAVSFAVEFNVGFGGSQFDLYCSKQFKAGTNSISINDGSNDISISADILSQYSMGVPDQRAPFSFFRLASDLPRLNSPAKRQIAQYTGNCTDGYKSGSITVTPKTGQFDCDTSIAAVANKFNDFKVPESIDSLLLSFTCLPSKIQLDYLELSAGYRPFVSIFLEGDDLYQLEVVQDTICSNGDDLSYAGELGLSADFVDFVIILPLGLIGCQSSQ